MYNNYDTSRANISELKVDAISLGSVSTKFNYNINDKIRMNSSTKEKKDCYEIKAEVHGIEELQISYERLTGLIVKGSKETLNGRKEVENTFSINEKIYNIEQISASTHKGILTICIGKREEYKEKVLCSLKNEESVVLSDKGVSKISYYDKKIDSCVKQKEVDEAIKRINNNRTFY